MLIPTIIGFTGSLVIMWQYILNITDRVRSDSFRYSCINCIASLMILSSLFYHYNAPAMFVETFWFLISIYGMIRAYRKNIWK